MLPAKHFCYARRRNNWTGTRRGAARHVAFDSGGRVCARRDGAHPRGQTWRALAGAGDRDWFVQSPPGWSEVATAQARQGANQTPGEARPRERPQSSAQKTFPPAFARREGRIETREPKVGLAEGVVAASKTRSTTSLPTLAFRGREESRAHTKTPSPITRSQDRQPTWIRAPRRDISCSSTQDSRHAAA